MSTYLLNICIPETARLVYEEETDKYAKVVTSRLIGGISCVHVKSTEDYS